MPTLTPYKTITVADGVDGTITAAENEAFYFVEGTETLTGNWNVNFSGTALEGMVCEITYRATVTLAGNSVVILGSTLPDIYAQIETKVIAKYNGASWDVTFLPDFQASNIIQTDHIIDLVVTTAKINDLAVTTGKVADLGITLGKMAADSVDENKIVSSALGAALTGGSGAVLNVAVGGISATHLAANAVETAEIKDLNVTNAKLAGSIALSKLVALTASRVPVMDGAGEITASAITATILGYLDATSSIQTQLDAKGGTALASAKLFIGSAGGTATAQTVTGDITITNGGVVAIATGVLVNADINASAAVNFSKLQALATGSIMAGNAGVPTSVVLGGDATINAAGSLTIAASAIDSGKLATDSVITVKIVDLNVTTAKINDLAVTAAKLNTDAVTNTKILDGEVYMSKLTSEGKQELITGVTAFEDADWIGLNQYEIPFKCSLKKISACVIKTIGITDSAYVEFKDDAGNTMTGTGLVAGKIEFSASDAVSTLKEATPTGNNSFVAGDILRVTPSKATPNGGFVLMSFKLERED